MKIIAIANQKRGVGKTRTTLNVGAELKGNPGSGERGQTRKPYGTAKPRCVAVNYGYRQ